MLPLWCFADVNRESNGMIGLLLLQCCDCFCLLAHAFLVAFCHQKNGVCVRVCSAQPTVHHFVCDAPI
jgi:hypothetical protein